MQTTTSDPIPIPIATGAVPVLGHSLSFFRDRFRFLRELSTQGDLVRVRLGSAEGVVVCNPDLNDQVLRDDRTFDKGGPFYGRAAEVFGGSLALAPYAQHRRRRRLAQPAFHPQRMPGYTEIIANHVDSIAETWRDGAIVDVTAQVKDLAAKTILATIFTTAMAPEMLDDAIDDIMTISIGFLRHSLMPPVVNRLPIPFNRRYSRAITRLHETLGVLVAQRRVSGIDTGDLLSALIFARDPETGGAGLSDIEIIEDAILFFGAGWETTAATLLWALRLLALHPEIDARVSAEASTVLNGRVAAHQDLPHLPLTSRVITETLRMYPPGWIVSRVATTDTRLGRYGIPAGTAVLISAYLIHHRADLYVDPERFDPDRWSPDQESRPRREAFIPFGGGARKCIGSAYGTAEAVLTLATIASRWRLDALPAEPVHPALSEILIPKLMRMRAHKRNVHADR